MQHFDRSSEPPPSILQSQDADMRRRGLREYFGYDRDKRAQTSAPFIARSLEDRSIRDALQRLFHGKCAFCEAMVPTFAYRFRPPFEAQPYGRSTEVHLYYAWLADAWENIYAICDSCGPAKPNFFPVKGSRAPLPTLQEIDNYVNENTGLWRNYPPKEVPLLLEPCVRADFWRSFDVDVNGLLVPRTDRGATTIETFNLNSAERLAGRRERYREYSQRLTDGLSTTQFLAEEVSPLFDFAALEFGGTWYLLLRRLALVLGGGGGSRPIISPSRIGRFYLQFSRQRNASARFQQAFARLEQENLGYRPEKLVAPASQSRARLIRIELRNFKSIEQLDLNMPVAKAATIGTQTPGAAPSLLILGENAAGKSTVLEAIALTLSGSAARDELNLEVAGLLLDPHYLGNSNSPQPLEGAVTITFDDGQSRTLEIAEDGYHGTSAPNLGFPPVFAYGAFRHYRDKQRNYSPAKYVKNLFHSDILLSNPERWLLALEGTRFEMVIRALRVILSIEGEFEVIERDLTQNRCFIVTATPGPNGTMVWGRTPLSVASSGYRAVLAMVCDIIQGLMDQRIHGDFETLTEARAVVLIDEVEAHLHPRWKMQIMRGLRAALPNVTFIATTHDPLCLRGMEDGEVLVLQRVASQESITPTNLPVLVESVVDLPKISQLTVEQLLTSDLFQLFSTDKPEMDGNLATMADILAKRRQNELLSSQETELLEKFEVEIAVALPVGASEAQRLVQEAVADYLKERRTASEARLGQLRVQSKARIVEALRGI